VVEDFLPTPLSCRDARQGSQVIGFQGMLHAKQKAYEDNSYHNVLIICRHYPVAMANFPLNHHSTERV
jgi:hypothetical protein